MTTEQTQTNRRVTDEQIFEHKHAAVQAGMSSMSAETFGRWFAWYAQENQVGSVEYSRNKWINRFKNGTHGHYMGNKAQIYYARVLMTAWRGTQYVINPQNVMKAIESIEFEEAFQ